MRMNDVRQSGWSAAQHQSRFSWVLAILLVLTIVHSKPIAAADEQPVINIERGHCEECWVYDLRLYPDGRIVYVGKHNVDLIGERAIQAAPEEVSAIVRELQELDFFSLSDKRNEDTDNVYTDIDCKDYMDPKLAGLRIADECQRGNRPQLITSFRWARLSGDIITFREGIRRKTLVVDNVHIVEARKLMEIIERAAQLVPIEQWTGSEHRPLPLRL
jgi:hypothetical protein